MPRKQKVSHSSHDDEESTILDRMPLAKAVVCKDNDTLAQLLLRALPNAKLAENVHLERSMGEAFTGGRSTPVYYVTARVTNAKGLSRERAFVIKLVRMLSPNSTGCGDDSSANKVVDEKLLHRRESYAVERRFYEYIAPYIRSSQHPLPPLHIPKLLLSDNNGNHPDAIACWLMTDVRVTHPSHPTVLKPKGDDDYYLLRALDWLAHFHARFWNSTPSETSASSDWRRSLWERGGFWNKGTGLYQGKNVSTSTSTAWLKTCQWLAKNHPNHITSSTKALGTRFEALQIPLRDFMLQQSKGPWSTLIHGDYKAANLFFRSIVPDVHDPEAGDSSKEMSEPDATCVAAVDFQYTGAGLPAEDVTYLLFPDAFVEYWDEEMRLLEYYHERLMEALIRSNKGGPSSLSFSSFYALYQLSRVEMMIHWLHKGWVASTLGDARLVSALQRTMDFLDGGKGAGNLESYHCALLRFVQ
jgi:hypothetical protein